MWTPASPGNLLQMQVPWPCPRPNESAALGPEILGCEGPLGDSDSPSSWRTMTLRK